ncbi:hypothetical protein EBBID32_23220 [Sphingobium indicum BiD32]|uniref:Uncharacterized protein n=1 Tax=Sphingobium indicum BiD32 TaxID=1301087 RepID=N1MQL5_9SPHN|nr:hypothetical protein EBBID32_23220 [Sphingobium indicum BiD32]
MRGGRTREVLTGLYATACLSALAFAAINALLNRAAFCVS